MKPATKILFAFFIVGAIIFGSQTLKPRAKPAPVLVLAAPETKLRITEGWDIADIAENVAYDEKRQQKIIDSAENFLQEIKNFDAKNYMLLSGRPKGASLEGYIFPDTYFLPQSAPTGTTISGIIISKALDNFSKKFTPEMETRAKEINMSVYEIITLASIVEKESGRSEEERKIVAGIFFNRLNIGMALESDATINYVTKKNSPAPSWEDLKTESPYNTYKNPGLPPGPIANPSLSAIMAVLYPTKTSYFFFLHKQPSGEPVYSKTFEEHVQNKFKYLK